MEGGLIFNVLQQMERDARKGTNNTDLSMELKKIASDKGFMISDNQGGGNCMFHALSEQLNLVKGIQISHQNLRHKVVNYLKNNPKLPDGTELFNFVDGYRSWDSFLTNMGVDGTWGDHVILHGVANCFGTCIHVISSQSHHNDVIINPERDVTNSNRLVLGHLHELHYVSLIPRTLSDRSGDEKKRSSSCCSTQATKRPKFKSSENAAGIATEENDSGSPPQISIKLLKVSDLPNTSKLWDHADLPVDILLLTVEDCEFLSCFYYLDKPFKSYCDDIGYVYFGRMGNGDQIKLKIALIKCSKGGAVPNGSLTAVKNAVRNLRPKAVFSVGTCIGLNSEKTNLGDVVVSSKLTTSVYKTPVSRNIGNLIKHAADGWKAPLENPDAREVKVHCDGDVLSHPTAASFEWRHEQIIQKYPEAIAVETEGEGVFAAAHDDKIEWALVKGVASYGECSQSLLSDDWKCFASTTAASVVANILSDPVIFQGWLHYNQEAYHVKPFDVKTCRSKLAEHYKRTAKVPASVWSSVDQVKLDQIYTRLSWVKKEQTPAGPSQSQLTHYSDLFTANEKGFLPKRILVQGQTGIGKSTFVKKLTVDWAELNGEKVTAKQKDALSRFELVAAVNLKDVSSCRMLKEVISHSRLFPEDEEISTDLLSYVRNNQEKVLLVFDGYDEYRTGSEAEARFGSRSNSPICKIFHGINLRGCTVLVTSRASGADELQGSADKHAEITGFDIEDQVAFMRKKLNSDSKVDQLLEFLKEKHMEDLARVPLLNLFFCLLWKLEEGKLMELIKTKTKLYRAIIRHILQYGHKRHFPDQVSKVKEENYDEILNEIGKVALESLLRGNQVFEYGQLSEKVRGKRSLIVGLLQLSECGASLEPMEVVSFIHKSIQEYLAAWYITNKCVSADNLGGIEEQARTLQDCEALENVFQFICGLSSEGAVKVFKHFSTVRVSYPLLDLAKLRLDEKNETYVPPCEVTSGHELFNDLVLNCVREVSLEVELVKHWFDCTGGVVLLNSLLGPELLLKAGVLIQAAHSWAFVFDGFGIWWFEAGKSEENLFYQLLKFLNLFHTPLKFVGSSDVLKLGDFLTHFRSPECEICKMNFILCCRDGQIQCYITRLELSCDAHTRVFTEAAAKITNQSLTANLCSIQPCLKFLTYVALENDKSMKDMGAILRYCKYLQRIRIGTEEETFFLEQVPSGGYACDILEQVLNPEACHLEICSCTATSSEAERFAVLLPRFPNITTLSLDLKDCCAEAVIILVTSITHITLETLILEKISFTLAIAAAFGRTLPEMTSLKLVQLTGKCGSILLAKEMEALFGGFNKLFTFFDCGWLILHFKATRAN